jgi:hypothetical protein
VSAIEAGEEVSSFLGVSVFFCSKRDGPPIVPFAFTSFAFFLCCKMAEGERPAVNPFKPTEFVCLVSKSSSFFFRGDLLGMFSLDNFALVSDNSFEDAELDEAEFSSSSLSAALGRHASATSSK